MAKKPIKQMNKDEKMKDAFNFMLSLVDIEDAPIKLGKTEEGYLRRACISQIKYLYCIKVEEAEEVIDKYIEHATK